MDSEIRRDCEDQAGREDEQGRKVVERDKVERDKDHEG